MVLEAVIGDLPSNDSEEWMQGRRKEDGRVLVGKRRWGRSGQRVWKVTAEIQKDYGRRQKKGRKTENRKNGGIKTNGQLNIWSCHEKCEGRQGWSGGVPEPPCRHMQQGTGEGVDIQEVESNKLKNHAPRLGLLAASSPRQWWWCWLWEWCLGLSEAVANPYKSNWIDGLALLGTGSCRHLQQKMKGGSSKMLQKLPIQRSRWRKCTLQWRTIDKTTKEQS